MALSLVCYQLNGFSHQLYSVNFPQFILCDFNFGQSFCFEIKVFYFLYFRGISLIISPNWYCLFNCQIVRHFELQVSVIKIDCS